MTKQFSFSFISKSKLTHGGEHSIGKRKTQRPLKMNKPIHLVLRAKLFGLKTKERLLQKIIKNYAEKFKIKIYQKSINSNHIHLIVSTPRRENFQHYLRSITGLMAKLMGQRISNFGSIHYQESKGGLGTCQLYPENGINLFVRDPSLPRIKW